MWLMFILASVLIIGINYLSYISLILKASFSSFQTFYVPFFQDTFLLFSSFFFKGPIYWIEVFIGNNNINWYYCHYFSNIEFITFFVWCVLLLLVDSFSSFCVLYVGIVMLTLLWSSWNAVSVSDVKSIIAFSTISQISYMFIILIINPIFCIYHIIIHALFKSLLFILSGFFIIIKYFINY